VWNALGQFPPSSQYGRSVLYRRAAVRYVVRHLFYTKLAILLGLRLALGVERCRIGTVFQQQIDGRDAGIEVGIVLLRLADNVQCSFC
jgi:hypothetical protein